MMKIKNPVYKFGIPVVVLLLVLSALVTSQPAAAATGQICDQYGTTTQGNYVIMNNRWGTSATQCINVTTNGFQIVRQDGTGNLSGAPVSYPAIYIGCHYGNCSPSTNLPMQISRINSAQTSVSLSFPSSGTYDAAYDIWLNADTNVSGVQDTEIMIWLHHTGSIQPVGSNTGTTVNLAGRSWAVWVGNNGQNNVVSYVGSGISSFSADIKPFLLDAITRGSGFGTTSWYLTSMQMGFEPWIGGVGLAVNSFSASVSSGGNNPTPTRTPTAVRTPTRTPTPGGGGGGSTCSPVNATISAPFTKDGAGTFCWQSSNLGSVVNSWNVTQLTINGVDFTNKYVGAGSYPAKINGYWYIKYTGNYAWSHFEVR
ncbi:MAG TPA: hypothetical protein VLE49_02900 [Anaerolineales bacterium]|nr:hypothetical protein [Anaerolineales bacterium]